MRRWTKTDQGLGSVWREKSFGQRLKFGAGGGKFVPLGTRTIFLDRPKRPIHLPIIRKSPIFGDVDTQFDFMRAKGKLYVTGATEKQILDILFEPIYVSYG